MHFYAQIAQLVEQWTENPRVTGSIPVLGIFAIFMKILLLEKGSNSLPFSYMQSFSGAFRYFFETDAERRQENEKNRPSSGCRGTYHRRRHLVFLFRRGGKGKGVEITVDGESKAFLPLGEDDSIRIDTDGGYNVITVKDGEVTVSEADCRDQICVEHKKIRKTGETIVCLPHKLVVTVTGDKPGDFDAVVM